MGKISNLNWKNIFYMVSYCIDELANFKDADINYERVNCLNDLLAELLCKSFEALYKNGYLKEYRREQLITSKPHGSLDIPKSIETGSIYKGNIACKVNSLNIDNKLNQVIKAAFSILIDANKTCSSKINEKTITKLNSYKAMLKDVSNIEVTPLTLNSLVNMPKWYKPAIIASKIIINEWITLDKASGLRFVQLNDKERLWHIWQSYLFNFCKKEYTSCKVYAPVFKDEGGNKYETDLVVERKDKNYAIIIDAKWYETSRADTTNISQVNTYEDLYIKTHNGSRTDGLLFYASDINVPNSAINKFEKGKTVTQIYININQDKELIENDIISIINETLSNSDSKFTQEDT